MKQEITHKIITRSSKLAQNKNRISWISQVTACAHI